MSVRILVIQVERLGDAFQSVPAISELLSSPLVLVDVLAVSEFAAAYDGGGERVRVHSLPMGEIERISAGLRDSSEGAQRDNLGSEMLERLQDCAFDGVLNLSHGLMAAWFAGKLRCRVRVGRYATERGEWLYAGEWFALLCALVDCREGHCFNLVDVYRGAARELLCGLQVACQAGEQVETGSRGFFSRCRFARMDEPAGWLVPLQSTRWVAINPGASDPDRRWPASFFAALMEWFGSCGIPCVLVGSPADASVCEAVLRESRLAALNLCGRTSVGELRALLRSACLLVSNDTGAIHVAASEDVRVLGLFGKNALFRETAPWGVGHVILQLPYGSGMDELPVGVAIQAAAYCLGMASEGEFATSRGLWSGSVWETYWLSDSHDRMGGVGYRPLSGKENVEREAWAFALRSAFPRMVSTQPSKTDVEVKAVWSGLRDSLSARRDSELESMARGYLRRLEGEAEGALGALAQGDFLAVRAGGEALIALLHEFKERVSWHAPMALIASYVDWRIRCLPEAPADVILAWTSGIIRKADALICEAAAISRQVSGGGIPREGVSREKER